MCFRRTTHNISMQDRPETRWCPVPSDVKSSPRKGGMYIPDLKQMKMIGPYTLLAYADDIIILGKFKYNIEESVKKLRKSN